MSLEVHPDYHETCEVVTMLNGNPTNQKESQDKDKENELLKIEIESLKQQNIELKFRPESEIAALQELVQTRKLKVCQLLDKLHTQEEDTRNAVNQADEMKLKLQRSEGEKANLAEEVCNILQRLEKSNMAKSDALQKLTKKEKHIAILQKDLQRANEQAITLKTKYDLLAQKYGEEAYSPLINYNGEYKDQSDLIHDATRDYYERIFTRKGELVKTINILNT